MHIPGKQNGAADALSRGDLASSQRLVPGPTPIPDSLLQCLVWGDTRLDKSGLDSLVRSFFVKGLAKSTQRAYTSGQKHLNFCTSAGLQTLPAGEEVLCKFAAKTANEGLKHRTIKTYMAGIRHLHIQEGLEDPFLPALSRLHYVLRGVKRSQGVEGASSRERLMRLCHLFETVDINLDKLKLQISNDFEEHIKKPPPPPHNVVGSLLPGLSWLSEGWRVHSAL